MKIEYKDAIAMELKNAVLGAIARLDRDDSLRPFHSALLPKEALFWSRFERSFSSSFGQRAIEEIAKIAAIVGGASDSSRQKILNIELDDSFDREIDNHLAVLRGGNRLAEDIQLEKVLSSIRIENRSGVLTNHRIIVDLWWLKNGINHYMSIKTAKPNIDQTAVAKRDLLRLKIADPKCKVYFGLYYNPYGAERSAYAHTPPMTIFDFHTDEVILIGKEFWDTLGGEGFYGKLLNIVEEVGNETRTILKNYIYS